MLGVSWANHSHNLAHHAFNVVAPMDTASSKPHDPAHLQDQVPLVAVGTQEKISKDNVAVANTNVDVLPLDTIPERPTEPLSEDVLEAAFQVHTSFVSLSTDFIRAVRVPIDY